MPTFRDVHGGPSPGFTTGSFVQLRRQLRDESFTAFLSGRLAAPLSNREAHRLLREHAAREAVAWDRTNYRDSTGDTAVTRILHALIRDVAKSTQPQY